MGGGGGGGGVIFPGQVEVDVFCYWNAPKMRQIFFHYLSVSTVQTSSCVKLKNEVCKGGGGGGCYRCFVVDVGGGGGVGIIIARKNDIV